MSEHPIIFQGWAVRAILERRKTQTRRVARQPWHISEIVNGEWRPVVCPFGQPGSMLWVRETWCKAGPESIRPIIYKADWLGDAQDHYVYDYYDNKGQPRWHPSIHMPRWASRLTLRLTDVRVQRIQEITEEDARAEGVEPMHEDDLGQTWKTYRRGFQSTWDAINAKRGYGWDANPFCWALTFVVERAGGG